MVALAFALVIATVIYAFGTTSGAHINPVVSVMLAATGRFPWGEVAPYVAAQLVGGVAGGLMILAVFGSAAADLGAGSTTPADGVSFVRAVVAEAVGTFLLVTAIMALAVDRRAPSGWAGLIIGLSVACAILVVAPVTGGSFNPARSLGPVVATALGGGDAAWGDLPIYVVGPLIGALAAALSYDLLARPRLMESAEGSRQGTQGDVRGRRVPADEARASASGPPEQT